MKFSSFFIYVQLIRDHIFALNFHIRLLFAEIQRSLLLDLLNLDKVYYEHQMKNLILGSFNSCFTIISQFSIFKSHFALMQSFKVNSTKIAIKAKSKCHKIVAKIKSLFILQIETCFNVSMAQMYSLQTSSDLRLTCN